MYCSSCGNEINEGTKFCPNCGAKVISAEAIKDPGTIEANDPGQTCTEEICEQEPKTYTPGLVLGIVSIAGGILIALVGWVCGIIGIVLSAKNMSNPKVNAKAGLICSIIGLAISVFSSIVGAVIGAQLLSGLF